MTIHPFFLMRRCRAHAPRIGDARTHRGRNTNVMSTNGGRFERPLPIANYCRELIEQNPNPNSSEGAWQYYYMGEQKGILTPLQILQLAIDDYNGTTGTTAATPRPRAR